MNALLKAFVFTSMFLIPFSFCADKSTRNPANTSAPVVVQHLYFCGNYGYGEGADANLIDRLNSKSGHFDYEVEEDSKSGTRSWKLYRIEQPFKIVSIAVRPGGSRPDQLCFALSK